MNQELAGKRVLVTGGTRGIGRAIVRAFADGGAHVVTGYHSNDAAAADLTRELAGTGGKHQVIKADITVEAGAKTLVDAARDGLGGLDVLVNNLGADGQFSFEDLTLEEWRRVIDRNLTSLFLVTHAAFGLLADGGSIVNLSSSAALRGRGRGVHYTASKAAVIGFTRALAKDGGHRRIRVNAIAPGLTGTEGNAGLPATVVDRIVGMTALGRIAQPEDVAGVVLFLAGDSSRYISGVTINVDGGV
jgi:3-oxoacyl-[acyl-carrier protein] reductase